MKSGKTALVLGAGGFIGTHLVDRLKHEGYRVCGVDLKYPEFSTTSADEFHLADLRDWDACKKLVTPRFAEIYQLAADMGGAGYIFSGENDFQILRNSSLINLHVAKSCQEMSGMNTKVFFASSACVYPAHNQASHEAPETSESSAYPAAPDSEYGWEKLYAERLFMALSRNHRVDLRIARLHNVFGPMGTWRGGKEKAPAAISRKVAEAKDGGAIELWGDGRQTRSFLFIDECIEGIRRLMESTFAGPLNLGSVEMLSIAELAEMIVGVSKKRLSLKLVSGPQGVRGRCSDNRLIQSKLGWSPRQPLRVGMEVLYQWIHEQVSTCDQKSAAYPSSVSEDSDCAQL